MFQYQYYEYVCKISGILKERWRCLKLENGIHYYAPTPAKIINACSALHNFCILEERDYFQQIPRQ